MKRATHFAVALWSVIACGKPSDASHTETTGAPAPDSGAASGESAPRASASASAPPGAPLSWMGTYRVAPAELYVPPEWKAARVPAQDAGGGIGEGELALTIDPASGRVTGTLDGPLGPALVDGVASRGTLRATIRRREANDLGFTGTLSGSATADRAEGSLHVARGDGSAPRSGTFEAKPIRATR